ncbi:MAG: hypothetical protein Q9161_005989 [Pseudevernia consocians]
MDVLNVIHSEISKANLVTTEDSPNDHQRSFKDNTTNNHLAAFKPNTFQKDRHYFSAPTTDVLKEPTHKTLQADCDTSNGYHGAAGAFYPSTNPTDDLRQTNPNMTNGTNPDEMRNRKVDLGPHASIVVREWKLLCSTVDIVTPMYVDTDGLGLANITAVSK